MVKSGHSVNSVRVWMHVDTGLVVGVEGLNAGQSAGPGQAVLTGQAGDGDRGHAQHRGAAWARGHGDQAAGAGRVHGGVMGVVVGVRVEGDITIHCLAIN